MKSVKLIALLTFCGIASAQQYSSSNSQGALGGQFSSSQYGPLATTTTPRPVYPPAQVHYVNIGEDLAGDYKFGYDTGKNGGGQSFREESRLPDGTVKGAYGYIDAEGKQRIVKYTAGIEGFKVESDEPAPADGSPAPQQQAAPAPRTYSPPARTYSPPPQSSQPPKQYQSGQWENDVDPPAPQARSASPATQYSPPQAAPQRYVPQPSYQPAPQPAQPLGGYTPVAASGPRYAPPPAAPSPLPNYAGAIAQASPNVYRSPAQPSSVPSYSATLAQRQPTLAQIQAAQQQRPAHLASLPRPGATLNYGGLTGGLVESTTWGPPVINKELLSYNIGSG